MSDPFIGQIMQVGFAYAPVNWLTCSGQVLQVSQNQALFALLGNRFGGNGTTNYALPDARGRAFIGAGQGPGLPNYIPGEKDGSPVQMLTINNLPTHSHASSVNGGGVTAVGQLIAKSGLTATDEAAEATPGAFLGGVLEQDTSPVLYVPANGGGTPVPLGGLQVNASYTPPSVAIENAGLNQPFSIMPPYLAVTTIIATAGIWPSQP